MRRIFHFFLLGLINANIVFGQNPSPVRTVPVKKEKIAEMKLVTGSLRASLSSDIASIEDGRIDEFFVQEGQRVAKGELLARLDERRITHEIDSLNAQINETKVRIDRVKNELRIHEDEVEALRKAEEDFNGSVSHQEFRDSRLLKITKEGEISTLEANLVTLQTQLQSLHTSLSDTEIKAAFDGVITRKFVEVGSWVAAGDKVVTLVNDRKLEAWLDIPESITPENFQKDLITIEANNRVLTIKEIIVVPHVKEPSRNYNLIVQVEQNEGDHLVPGMSVKATIPNGFVREQLLISADAVSRNGAGYFVFKVQKMPDGAIAVPITIEIFFRQGSLIAVHSELLQAGDLVITEGNERLFPMMPILVLSEEQM